MTSSSPIAVLDTGAGGLSVVRAIRTILPREDIHYFADTAHLPYGLKSPELIKYLALKMAKRLSALSSCKIMVVACHTISVWCLMDIEKALNVPVIGMVAPTIMGLSDVVQKKPLTSVGIISTKATVNSRVYRDAWSTIDPSGRIALVEHPSGPLVSLVEEADINEQDLAAIVEHFLPPTIKSCDALLIGSTHFSALVPTLERILRPGCYIVDAADFTARATYESLVKSQALTPNHGNGTLTIYVSDNPLRFKSIARKFMEGELMIELLRDYART